MQIKAPSKAQKSNRDASLSPQRMHTQYRNAQGVRIPGVSTILGNCGWSTQGLLIWQKNLLMQGLDPDASLAEAALLGTTCHTFLEDWFHQRPTDTTHMTTAHVAYAQAALYTFATWAHIEEFRILETEQQVISEKHQYGGTFDVLAVYQDKFVLADYKTSKSVYATHKIQIASYALAYTEQHPDTPIDALCVIKLGGDKEDFKVQFLTPAEWDAARAAFLCLRQLHELKKMLD